MCHERSVEGVTRGLARGRPERRPGRPGQAGCRAGPLARPPPQTVDVPHGDEQLLVNLDQLSAP
jgi:hypothetical protein